MNIHIGDYIEGYELIGNATLSKICRMRVVVSQIYGEVGSRHFYGKADDGFCGARGTIVREEFGDIQIITDEEPFNNKWQENKKLYYTSLTRDWHRDELIIKSNREVYKIVDTAINRDTLEQFVVYTDLKHSTLYVEPRELFERLSTSPDQVFEYEKCKLV